MSKLFSVALIFLNLTISGCYASEEPQTKTRSSEASSSVQFSGKWLIDAKRNPTSKTSSEVYLFKNGQIKELGSGLLIAEALFSPSGQKILAAHEHNALYILNENGDVLQQVKTEYYPNASDWVDEDNIVYAQGWTDDKKTATVILHNLQTGESRKLYEIPKGYEVYQIKVSRNREKAAYVVVPTLGVEGDTFVLIQNFRNQETRKLNYNVGIAGWLTDNRYAVIHANYQNDGTHFNDRFGILGKFDTETGKIEIIKEAQGFYLNIGLSKDGKKIYYSKPVPSGGSAIFIQSLEGNREWQITTPAYLGPGLGYSSDASASWYEE